MRLREYQVLWDRTEGGVTTVLSPMTTSCSTQTRALGEHLDREIAVFTPVVHLKVRQMVRSYITRKKSMFPCSVMLQAERSVAK